MPGEGIRTFCGIMNWISGLRKPTFVSNTTTTFPKSYPLGLQYPAKASLARPHRTLTVSAFLEECFENRVIALNYSTFTGRGIDWPPYSPDLPPPATSLRTH
ncbi:hypothetical protein AVEN_189286-1 [Araneus ventricosus]|uniref:Tc1-like transposase DDE domain-containing protein n=1 Tax=Araneus ventricosus TaxID=182803 RepID=A0A4Y2MW80_ARAVE|nr:hypothetical protein AVEN_189286-1 [Araneus ventricosus]